MVKHCFPHVKDCVHYIKRKSVYGLKLCNRLDGGWKWLNDIENDSAARPRFEVEEAATFSSYLQWSRAICNRNGNSKKFSLGVKSDK